MGPFVGSDDHIVRVVNRNGNACRQARVHWLLASLVLCYCVGETSLCHLQIKYIEVCQSFYECHLCIQETIVVLIPTLEVLRILLCHCSRGCDYILLFVVFLLDNF